MSAPPCSTTPQRGSTGYEATPLLAGSCVRRLRLTPGRPPAVTIGPVRAGPAIGHSPVMRLRQRIMRIAAGPAVAALVLQLFVTALFAPAMAFAATGIGAPAAVTICTPGGIANVGPDLATDHERSPSRGDGLTTLCPICLGLAGHAFAIVHAECITAAPASSRAVASPRGYHAPDDRRPLRPVSRGPPTTIRL